MVTESVHPLLLFRHAIDNVVVVAPVKIKFKVKFFPYSLPSVGPGADPGVQAVSPQVT